MAESGRVMIQYMGQFTVSIDGARAIRLVLVVDGWIWVAQVTPGAYPATWRVPNPLDAAAPPLSATGRIGAAFLDGICYFVDGSPTVAEGRSAVLALDVANGVMTPYGDETTPQYCRLACSYRGRLVLASPDGPGANDTPHNFYMSRVGDPSDWDYGQSDPAAAVMGNRAERGQIGDLITGLMPWRDDLLVFGCDHTLYRMTGDIADGGSLDLIDSAVGVLGDRAWTMGPGGILFFVGQDGLYQMAPGGAPLCISRGRQDDFFAQLDRSANAISLQWDQVSNGCWVFVTPTDPALPPRHLWYDAGTDGFWPMAFADAVGPLCSLHWDADGALDRRILLGGRDDEVRYLDADALSDQVTSSVREAIASHVLLGPILPGGAFASAKLIQAEVILGEALATWPAGSWNVHYDLLTAPDAAALLSATPSASGSWSSGGRIGNVNLRGKGACFGLRLSNNTLDKGWSLERIVGRFEPAGRTR